MKRAWGPLGQREKAWLSMQKLPESEAVLKHLLGFLFSHDRFSFLSKAVLGATIVPKRDSLYRDFHKESFLVQRFTCNSTKEKLSYIPISRGKQ